VLNRKLAQRGHYPAIDVLGSISRLANRVAGECSKKAAQYMRKLMAVYADAEDMIQVGAYQKGSNPAIDEAIAHHDKIETFLQQEVNDPAPIEKTLEQLSAITHIDIPNEESFQAGAGAAKKYLMPSEAADLYKAEIEKPPEDYAEE